MDQIGTVLQLLGYIGMILFADKFAFGTTTTDWKYIEARVFGFQVTAYSFWIGSWALIIFGSLLTLFALAA